MLKSFSVPITFIIIVILSSQSICAQNIGIGTATPHSPLHLKSSTASDILRVEGNNPYISFYDLVWGYRGYLWGTSTNMELGSAFESGIPVIISPGLNPTGYFTTTGRFGVGEANPAERLDVSGNINLSNSLKGVIMNGTDRPLITRGLDPFSSGTYSGLGRWGLFKEPNRLTLGIPNISGKGFNVSSYDANSSVAKNLLTVTPDGTTSVDGELNRPSKTGTANLLPIAYGTINGQTGAVKTGSGNYSVFKTSAGSYIIEIQGETYSPNTHVVNVTPYGAYPSFTTVVGDAYFSPTGFRVMVWNAYASPVSLADADLSFVVYKP